MHQKTKWSQFSVLISVFFFWGFVAASNDILIPVFQQELGLKAWQSQLISLCFYVPYTIGAVIYYFVSKNTGGDILNRIGYKNGIALGLLISALGTLLFYPAAETASFPLILTGLFIVGLGFSLQQTAANPLAIVMGDPKKGSQRLSMAGGVNNFGTTIGPLLVSYAIFGAVLVGEKPNKASISDVKTPYLILGGLFLIVAAIFKYSSLPNKIETPDEDVAIASPTDVSLAEHGRTKTSAVNFSQLSLGMLAIFLYVGVEVSTAANLPHFMSTTADIPTAYIAPYVSLFWASLMIGRWTGAVGAFDVSKGTKQILNFLMPYLAFAVFLLVNIIAKHEVSQFYIYAAVIPALIIGDLLSKGNPARQLLIFSVMGIAALITGMLSTNGMVSVFAFISVGLFCSTLWPCIFTLSIAGLGKFTNQGANFLIMMIMGGGIMSMLQGLVSSDNLLGIRYSFFVGVACFAYLAFYAIRAKSILKAQGIDYDQTITGGH